MKGNCVADCASTSWMCWRTVRVDRIQVVFEAVAILDACEWIDETGGQGVDMNQGGRWTYIYIPC